MPRQERKPRTRVPLRRAARAEVARAITLREEGRLAEAEAALRAAIRLRHWDPAPHALLGDLLAEQGRVLEAAAAYHHGWEAVPKDASAWFNLGCVLLEARDEACGYRAEEAFLEALRLDPQDAAAWNNRGVALKRAGFLGEAVGSFREAIALRSASSTCAAAWFNLGATLHALDRLDEAEAAYREAIRLAPNDAMAHRNLAILGARASSPHVQNLNLGARASSPPPDMRAGSPRSQEELEASAAAAREAVQLDPKDAEAGRVLARTLAELGDVEAALAAYRDAARRELAETIPNSDLGLARFPAAGSVLVRRARWCRWVEACARRRMGDNYDRDRLTPDNERGLEFAALGEHSAAVAAYRDAIQSDPKDAAPHANLAVSLWEQGDLPAALASCEDAVRLDAAHAGHRFLYGLLLRDAGRPAEAIAALRAALARCPGDPEVHVALALALEEAEEPEAARPEWEQAMALDLKLSGS